MLSELDSWMFAEGTHLNLYDKLGAHFIEPNTCYFAVWAPNVSHASVIGDFNHWNPKRHPLKKRSDGSGIWELTTSPVHKGAKYKFLFSSNDGTYRLEKGDPFAFFCEQPPGNASIVWELNYEWKDAAWMKKRKKKNELHAPISIYEMHHPSWRRVVEHNHRPLTYLELAKQLPDYLIEMGYTHVEFLPVMEHPLYSSWGYQTLGYFAPSSRYGTPQDFMHLIDVLHQNGLGVILDWAPAHFPTDLYGLAHFDGTPLYEYGEPHKGRHPQWNTLIFDYSSPQVQAFLISNAFFWLNRYHVDGLRVDAVSSMLYLDYARGPGQWTPNKFGGKENIEAVDFIRKLNTEIYAHFPDVQTFAEESTEWPMVSRPLYVGGLGFGMKWNMGWMHDTLKYMALDPIFRKYHHNALLFSIHYAFFENFILPLSHDEVVHEKKSLLGKMPGDGWQKFASLRLLYGYMYGHPGKKLLFMGGEFGQWREWDHDQSLDWHLLSFPLHLKLQQWVKDLNHFYKSHPALYECDFSPEGFEWIDTNDWEQSIISFVRKSKDQKKMVLVICNFTPIPRHNYRVGVPIGGCWKEMLNSDEKKYGGSGVGNAKEIYTERVQSYDRTDSFCLTLPPLGVLFLRRQVL